MTRIVTTHYRYKRPPRKRKAVALEAPAIVTAKGSRRPPPVGGKGEAAAEVRLHAPTPVREGAVQPSTPREAARVITPPHHSASPANDDRKPAIVTATSKKQLKLLRADKRAPTTDGDPEMRAWLLRAMQGRWPRDD
jgi:hypothetical protein